jgi:hypothetical protein
MMRRPSLAALCALVVLAAGCGGLGTPDLETGVVSGRLVGGVAGKGYAYPLGRPDLKQLLGSDGGYRITVPVGTSSIVLYDGTSYVDGGSDFGRAELVEVEVEGAQEQHLGDRNTTDMPYAGGVLAGVRAGGAVCDSPKFTVVGTNQVAQAPAGAPPSAYLTPLPVGAFQVVAEMAGFQPGSKPVQVVSGASTQVTVDLEPDESEPERGCQRNGCYAGLQCAPDGSCKSGQTTGTCGAACGSGNPCNTGLVCGGNQQCTAPGGCDGYAHAMGGFCYQDSDCTALSGGKCVPHDEQHGGYCTAACDQNTPCPQGFTCSTVAQGQVCLRGN